MIDSKLCIFLYYFNEKDFSYCIKYRYLIYIYLINALIMEKNAFEKDTIFASI